MQLNLDQLLAIVLPLGVMAVTFLRTRGYPVPILGGIIDFLANLKQPKPTDQATPNQPSPAPQPAPQQSDFPIINAILSALRNRTKVSFSHDPITGQTTFTTTPTDKEAA